jgi:putative pyruvate formate lyase activating enzyme
MPDIKYAEDANALTYSGAGDYWRIVRDAVREMHRQVGNLHLDGSGTATRGLLIRHLVLPRRVAGTRAVLEFVAREISTDSYINIMDQYRPSYQASRFEEINRPITAEEYDDALRHAERLGLRRGFSTDNHLRLRASLQ